MRRFSKWTIRPQTGGATLPEALLTAPAPLPAEDMAPVVSLLLPSSGGAEDLLAQLDRGSAPALGLFLADPNLVPARLVRMLERLGVGWVCNLPSVGQHEHEFRRYLSEVDLDHDREMRVLARLRAAGISTIATVSATRDVAGARAGDPSALLVVPPVPDFADAPPDLDRRRGLERAVRDAAKGYPVIGLRAADEDGEGLDAALLPPEPVSR